MTLIHLIPPAAVIERPVLSPVEVSRNGSQPQNPLFFGLRREEFFFPESF